MFVGAQNVAPWAGPLLGNSAWLSNVARLAHGELASCTLPYAHEPGHRGPAPSTNPHLAPHTRVAQPVPPVWQSTKGNKAGNGGLPRSVHPAAAAPPMEPWGMPFEVSCEDWSVAQSQGGEYG